MKVGARGRLSPPLLKAYGEAHEDAVDPDVASPSAEPSPDRQAPAARPLLRPGIAVRSDGGWTVPAPSTR